MKKLLLAAILANGCGGLTISDNNMFMEPCRHRYEDTIHITFTTTNLSVDLQDKALALWEGVGYSFSRDSGVGNVRVEDMTDPNEEELFVGYTDGERVKLGAAVSVDELALTHELGHVLGIQFHIDSYTHPSNECHIMNAKWCQMNPVAFTNEDLDKIDAINTCAIEAQAIKNNQ